MKLSEKLFFGNLRNHFLELFNLNSTQELKSKETLTIPTVIFEKLLKAVKETKSDVKEREIEFFEESGSIKFHNHIGTSFNFETNEATVSNKSFLNSMAHQLTIFFGKPLLIHAHTHPFFSKEFLTNQRVKPRINKVDTTIELVSDVFLNHSKYPSDDDLRSFIANHRYVRNMLIGTPLGYIFIVNPNFKIPLITRAKGLKLYAAISNKINKENTAKILKNPEIGFDDYHKKRMQALIQFCEKNQVLLFANNDYNSPNLNRAK